jgi:hypothetical protein
MRPKTQARLKFDNTCNCVVDYELLERAMLWYSDGVLKSDRVIFIHAKYPAVNIYYEKILIHRLIAMYIYKAKVCSSIHAHHKDGDKLNCSKHNIELINASAHMSHHNKGKRLSLEHRMKISEAGKKRKGMKIKRKHNLPVDELKEMLEDGWSINKISRHYGCDWSTVKLRINENPELL